MKVSYNWLKELIDFDCSTKELAELLTMSGSEVESIEERGASPDGIVTGRVLKVDNHPDADRLTVCSVDVGSEKLSAVCGAPNVRENQNVIFAKVGATLTDGTKLKQARIRGVESFGMIVAEDEIGISDDHTGIIVLGDEIKPGIPISNIIALKDYILELEITPNRPDCLSHIGIAREIKAMLGGKIKYPDFSVEEAGPETAKDLIIEIDDPDGCPRYTGRLVSGVKIKESPLWLKARLYNLGIRPINNVVDITNYVLLETGHPLHAFDYSFFKTKKAVIRRARDGERFITLDEQAHTLNAGHLLITDGENGVALAGIMGGLNSEVSDSTTDILLESAYFDPVTTRRGARAAGLSTESSQRFERGADVEMAPKANNRACRLIAELGGGKIHKGMVDAYPKKFAASEIEFRPERANYVLGSNIKTDRMMQILDGLDIKYQNGQVLKIYQPSFRPDLTREIDIIEEIARIYGLENIENVYRPGGALETGMSPMRKLIDQIRNLLVGRGFHEIFSLTLVDGRQLKKIDSNTELVALVNPLSEEMSALRPNLLFSVARALKQNINYGNKDVKLYEIGTAYNPSSEELPDERDYLCLGITGRERPVSWRHKDINTDFYSLRGELESLFDSFKMGDFQLPREPNPYFDDDLSFAIEAGENNARLGNAGKISQNAAKLLGLKQECFLAQINLPAFSQLALKPVSFSELPRYPASDRDIAIIVDNNITAGELIESIYKSGGKLVIDVFPFDLYKGKNIEEGKKSIALRIIYRSDEKTLTDEEVDKVHDKVVKEVTGKYKAELRT